MPEIFYDGHWGQCLELLSHLCQYSDNILLVTGPHGIGKTTMKQALKNIEADKHVFCDIKATPHLTAEYLTETIELDFNEVADKDFLLLIDDAENLSLDVMAVLLQLNHKSKATNRFSIVLFATAELEQKISRSVLKDEFAEQIHTIEIEPLTVTEIELFVKQQLANCDNDTLTLDRAKCKKIHAQTGGIPGKVQTVVQDLIMNKEPTRLKEQHGLSPFMVGVTVSFGVLFCILAVLWPTADDSTITVKNEQIVAQSLPDPEVVVAVAPAATPVVEQEVAAQSASGSVVAPAADVAAVAPDVAEAPANVAATVPAIVNNNYDEKIEQLERKLTVLQQQIAKEQEARKATEIKFKQILGRHQPETKVTHLKKSFASSKHENNILSMPSKNYTLQLLCDASEQKVKDFIKGYNLQTKANYYKSNFKGKNWYIVVYGNFATKSEAQIAMAKLPLSIKKLHPWMREYSNVQASIRKRAQND